MNIFGQRLPYGRSELFGNAVRIGEIVGLGRKAAPVKKPAPKRKAKAWMHVHARRTVTCAQPRTDGMPASPLITVSSRVSNRPSSPIVSWRRFSWALSKTMPMNTVRS